MNMLSPKKTKYRKQFKGRIHGNAKGNFTLKKTPKQNDNFDFRINLNNTEYVSYPLNVSKKLLDKNDTLNISIETMEDMYIYIFQWLPFQDINSVFKIFPAPDTGIGASLNETDFGHLKPAIFLWQCSITSFSSIDVFSFNLIIT